VTLEAALRDAGLDLTARLPAEDYDACVPPAWRASADCQSVLVVGNAGGTLWRQFSRTGGRSLDRHVHDVLRRLAPEAFATYSERRQGRPLPLVALAERAGLGRPGRIGLLLHPTYGPWISLRAVVYSDKPAAPPPALEFDPCTDCPAPCATACRGGVIAQDFDGEGCFRTKLTDRGCRVACDARAACVIGPEHAFPPDAVAHHSKLHLSPELAVRAAAVLVRGLLKGGRRSRA
jgi:hypothetical protein